MKHGIHPNRLRIRHLYFLSSEGHKQDGWVTIFVETLKNEIEATFKEDISIYFDENPHDGLLDTHQVDESLAKKLKCLIFIPIISQTYCDPNSFAWQKEFIAFRDMASMDQYGLKVNLPNGNIASRILPIKIHDLENEDVTLFETEVAGVMRAVDFIYNEPGVNRPLRSNEAHPDKNLNSIDYRNQINKVANSIKEVISGLRNAEFASKSTPNEKINTPTQYDKMPLGEELKQRNILSHTC